MQTTAVVHLPAAVHAARSGSAPPAPSSCTLIYALPPVIRIARLRRSATSRRPPSRPPRSLGQTNWQRLKGVELPMAKRTIIVGINQTMMAALVDGRRSRRSSTAPASASRSCRPDHAAASARRSWPACASSSWRSCSTARPRPPACTLRQRARSKATAEKKQRRHHCWLVAGVARPGRRLPVPQLHLGRRQPFPEDIDLGTPIADRSTDVRRLDDRPTCRGFTSGIQRQVHRVVPQPDAGPDRELAVVASPGWRSCAIALARRRAPRARCRGHLPRRHLLPGPVEQRDDHARPRRWSPPSFVMILAVVFGVWMGRSKTVDRVDPAVPRRRPDACRRSST